MAYTECSVNYKRMKILDLSTFSGGIVAGYYKNTSVFTSPPLSKAQFQALAKAYSSTYAEYKNGGKVQESNFKMAKKALLEAIDKIAQNVNEVADGNENTVLKAGFKPHKVVRSAGQTPPIPEIEKIDRGGEGEILTRCNRLGIEVYYGCLLCEGAPLPAQIQLKYGQLIIPAGNTVPIYLDENKSRKKSFRNLKPGTRYYAYFFARNSTGVSLLSEARSIICG